MTLGGKVRRLLKQRKLTQTNLAQACGVEPSVLSRVLAGRRPWRSEHVVGVAAALAMTPSELVDGTDEAVPAPGVADAEFVSALTERQGILLAENARLLEERAELEARSRGAVKEVQVLGTEVEQLRHALQSERRERLVLETEKREAETREGAMAQELGGIKRERTQLRSDLDAARRQLAVTQSEYGKAVEIANRNYAVAKEFEKQLATSKGVATVAGAFGLAMLLDHAFSAKTKCP